MFGWMIAKRDINGDEMNIFSTLRLLTQLAAVPAMPQHSIEEGKNNSHIPINFLPIPSFTHLCQITLRNLNNIPQQQVYTRHIIRRNALHTIACVLPISTPNTSSSC
ncbi:hypothetical protein E4T47_04664 [Aureobasidium subglaciale]|nr:hypothetical protein E4T47_04664 [Aureobasidium subglaciale]